MSTRPGAKLMDIDEDIVNGLDLSVDIELLQPTLFIGEPLKGNAFMVVHTCPFCRASMQTMGIGHGVYYCSSCASGRTRNVEMTRSYENLGEWE